MSSAGNRRGVGTKFLENGQGAGLIARDVAAIHYPPFELSQRVVRRQLRVFLRTDGHELTKMCRELANPGLLDNGGLSPHAVEVPGSYVREALGLSLYRLHGARLMQHFSPAEEAGNKTEHRIRRASCDGTET